MKRIGLLITFLLLLTLETAAIEALTLRVPKPGKSGDVPLLVWQKDLEAALTVAEAEYLPVLVLFSSPDCHWCSRMKSDVLTDPGTVLLLELFSLVEIDVSRNKETAVNYQVRGVPTVLILSSDGRVQDGVSGYIPGDKLRNMLGKVLNPKFMKQRNADYAKLLRDLNEMSVPKKKWPDIMIYLGSEGKRAELHNGIFALDPFPRKEVVALLGDARIAVRLGALEILEELAGSDFGFDPWIDKSSGQSNSESLTKWEAWATEENPDQKSVYSALTQEQLAIYIQDLISDNRERSIRAMRMLEHGGANTAQALSGFLKKNQDLPIGARKRIQEVQYSLFLPPTAGVMSSVLAHRLVFGTLDIRLKSIASLQSIGTRCIPILKEFLGDPDSIVRETAVDALVTGGRGRAVPLLAKHIEHEKDGEVVYAILRGLGAVRSKHGLKVLTSYLTDANEDLVIVALNSIAKLKSRTVSDEIVKCLDDPRWRVRVAALNAAGKLKLGTLQEKIEGMLDDEDDFVRYSAVKTLPLISAKKAASKLEEAFLREDQLKGPIVAAFGSMDMVLPRSFEKALEGKKPDILLAVIDALEDCDARDLKLAAKFLDHDNLDVACAAIRLIGSKGMEISEHRLQITGILQSDSLEKVLAALESINVKNKQLVSYRTILTILPSDTEAAKGSAADEKLETLFDAFFEEDTPKAEEEKPSGEEAKAVVDDILAAFAGDDEQSQKGDGVGTAASGARNSLSLVVKQVESCLQSGHDKEMRFKAALLLARLRNPAAIPFLEEGLSSRTVQERTSIAGSLSEIKNKSVLPLLKQLLQDPSETVREEAAESCLEHEGDSAFLDAIFEGLLCDGTRLKPYEIYGYQLESLIRKSSPKRTVRKWAWKILTESTDQILQNFALILLEKTWKKGDENVLEKFLRSENHWQRRAAFHALGKGGKGKLGKELTRAAKDPSEYVRMVVPNVYTRGTSKWIHYFDKTHFDQDHYYWSTSHYGRRRLAREVKEALVELTGDPSAKVRVEAFFCLLSNREKIDLVEFVGTIDSLPDRKAITRRVANYLTNNYKQLGPGFKILVPYLEEGGSRDASSDKVRKHFGGDPDTKQETLTYINRSGRPEETTATFLAAPEEPVKAVEQPELALIYFTSHGCSDCERVERLFPQLRECFPGITIDTHNIRKVAAMRLNEALCERFDVPEAVRLVTPVAFCSGGYLLKKDITFARLGETLAGSASVPLDEWYVVPKEELAKADVAISKRYSALGSGVVVLAGLLDGINPCAFATIIFLLSYLQITHRRPGEIAQVGLAFIAGVFIAYFVLGLGLVEVVSRLSVLRRFSQIFNWIVAAFALVIMIISIRDGVLCLHGKLKDITLQLPKPLKTGIQNVIRRGARHSRFVIAAFVVGVAISFLELACTGQVYAPTILFMLKTGKGTAGTVSYLAIYNIAFVIPLFVIFILAYYGMKHDALVRFLHKRAAMVKFCTAGLFLILAVFLVFGDRILSMVH